MKKNHPRIEREIVFNQTLIAIKIEIASLMLVYDIE